MQIQPYTRPETHLAPISEQRGTLAERRGSTGYSDWNGHSGQNGTTAPQAPQNTPQPVPHAAFRPSNVEVLFEKIKGRWKLLLVWLAITAIAAAIAVDRYGKPMWRAEGSLYYSPNYSFAHKRLYTPPNIQTILALARSPEVLERVRGEMGLTASVGELQSKLTVNIVKQSDLISVSFDWPNRDQAEAIANRIIELAIEQYDHLLHRLAVPALLDLDQKLKAAGEEEITMRQQLNEKLAEKKISNLDLELTIIANEISSLDAQIKRSDLDKAALENKLIELDTRVRKLLAENKSDLDGGLSENEVNIKRMMTDIRQIQITRQREIEQAKVRLKALEEEYKRLTPAYQIRAVSEQEWAKLKGDIDAQKVIIGGTKEIQEMEKELDKLQASILDGKKVNVALPLQQVRKERIDIEVALAVLPYTVRDLIKIRDERYKQQQYLKSVEKDVMPIQQQIKNLDQRRADLSSQKKDHDHLEGNKVKELTRHTTASAGGAPNSSNFMKIGMGVFALSMLLFVGFVAWRDMPRNIVGSGPVPAPVVPTTSTQLPIPAWQHYQQPPNAPQRGTSMNNEHLRALAERMHDSVKENGSIVLFTPLMKGLRVEALLGDLACFCQREGGRVLVFEARSDAENPSYPAWTGPSSREVADQLQTYLDGTTERSAGCFAETLLSSIDYARGDLARQLSGVMSMYRFRRLMHDIKERYSIVLMITPERFQGGEDDVFTTLAEGIVVVINQDADPADVEGYLRQLRESETPVFGAVTVPPSKG